MRPVIAILTFICIVAPMRAQHGLPEGPTWGRPMTQPTAANVLFATADGCANCHSAADDAIGVRDATGRDVSPHGLWRGTMMANSVRDPYWRAQVAREIAADPERADEIQALCVTCHAPTAHHTARVAGTPSPSVREVAADPLAVDGVTCTVCHQARPDGLGEASSFGGHLDIRPDRVLYGPYPDPTWRPMRMHSAFMPEHGAHVQRAALCGSCHTLETRPAPDAAPFPEQMPYLEWRNSDFSDEGGRTESSRTCQECHMPNFGSLRIARNPMGRDFNIAPRPDYRGHAFVGGNAYMLGLLDRHRDELGVSAPSEALTSMARATRRQLKDATATITVEQRSHEDGILTFAVKVVNLTGHKFPTGYPARRAWLFVEVAVDGEIALRSGDYDERGRILGVVDERAIAHPQVVERADQVAVFEALAADLAGVPTTLLTTMATYTKDTRLLPRGWRIDGPGAERTRPVGVDGDPDFVAGSDTVLYRVPAARGASIDIAARLLYQPIPPSWVDPLRTVDADEARRFVGYYDETPCTPELIAVAVVGK